MVTIYKNPLKICSGSKIIRQKSILQRIKRFIQNGGYTYEQSD
jgi:hypothetical protein